MPTYRRQLALWKHSVDKLELSKIQKSAHWWFRHWMARWIPTYGYLIDRLWKHSADGVRRHDCEHHQHIWPGLCASHQARRLEHETGSWKRRTASYKILVESPIWAQCTTHQGSAVVRIVISYFEPWCTGRGRDFNGRLIGHGWVMLLRAVHMANPERWWEHWVQQGSILAVLGVHGSQAVAWRQNRGNQCISEIPVWEGDWINKDGCCLH